jgi:Protein of unknown function (DUF3619)
MTNSPQYQAEMQQHRYGLRVAARLSASADELPYEVSERLRASRVRALAVRKVLRTAPVLAGVSGGTALLSFDDEGLSLWNRIASVFPLIVLVAGLVAINVVQNERRANEVAEVDAALLTDDLPPAAYADPGFAQFLRSSDE